MRIKIVLAVLALALWANPSQSQVLYHWSTKPACVQAVQQAQANGNLRVLYYKPSLKAKPKNHTNQKILGQHAMCVRMELPEALGKVGYVFTEEGRDYWTDLTTGNPMSLAWCDNGTDDFEYISLTPAPLVAHDGTNGVSVTTFTLSPGDPNCPYGGAKFVAVNGTTYACSGRDGQNGTSATGVVSYQPSAGGTDWWRIGRGLLYGGITAVAGGIILCKTHVICKDHDDVAPAAQPKLCLDKAADNYGKVWPCVFRPPGGVTKPATDWIPRFIVDVRQH